VQPGQSSYGTRQRANMRRSANSIHYHIFPLSIHTQFLRSALTTKVTLVRAAGEAATRGEMNLGAVCPHTLGQLLEGGSPGRVPCPASEPPLQELRLRST
jgi:hypothetical protein